MINSKDYHKDLKQNAEGKLNCEGSSHSPILLRHDTPFTVTYTYNIHWIVSLSCHQFRQIHFFFLEFFFSFFFFFSSQQRTDKEYNTRWDSYLYIYDSKIHWFSLINSFVIVIFLTFMVAMILLRALHLDISRYNDPSQEEAQEEYGWKLVHGDVFRTPNSPILLSVLTGNGVQILLMCLVTLALALLGFLSPSIRGSLVTVSLAFYVCFGYASGYTSARLYKMFGGEAWKRCVLLSATLVPGTLSFILIILNFFLVGAGSSAAIPFPTLVGLLALWILVSSPLCIIGAFVGFRKTVRTPPCSLLLQSSY